MTEISTQFATVGPPLLAVLFSTAIMWGGAAFRGIVEIERTEGVPAMVLFIVLLISGIHLLFTPTYLSIVYLIWSVLTILMIGYFLLRGFQLMM